MLLSKGLTASKPTILRAKNPSGVHEEAGVVSKSAADANPSPGPQPPRVSGVIGVADATTKPKKSYDRKTHKKCTRCRTVKPLEEFGAHEDNADGKQVHCYKCKNLLGKQRQNMNVKARLRHHIATRATTQLGELAPDGLTKNIEDHLGYRLSELVKRLRAHLEEDYPEENYRLRDVLNAGWHVDHTYPLSKFAVVVEDKVDWEEFKRCWDPANLRAIPAEDNLKKGAKVVDLSETPDPFDV